MDRRPSLDRSSLWSGSALSHVYLDKRPSQLGCLHGYEALSVRRPPWTGNPVSREVPLDRKLSQSGQGPSLSRMPPKSEAYLDRRPTQSGRLSGWEALSVSRPLCTGGPLSHLAPMGKRPSVKRSLRIRGSFSQEPSLDSRASSQEASMDRRPCLSEGSLSRGPLSQV